MVNGFFTWPTLYRDMVERFPSGSTFVEVGVLEGKSLIYLIDQIVKSGKNIRVIGVDHFEGQSEGLSNKFYENIKLINYPFELMIGKSVESALLFEDKSVDFVFIDAAHDYKSVRADILAWLPKCKGVIAGHDYPAYPGVVKAVNEIFDKIYKKYMLEGCWLKNISNG